MVATIKENGGCEIVSLEASRGDLQTFVFEGFRRGGIPYRVLAEEKQNQLVRNTYAVVYKGKRLFLTIFGPDDPSGRGGVDVDVSVADHPPKHLSPQAKVDWPN
jgi:hypothetical protein